MITILAVDPGASSGYAAVRVDSAAGVVTAYGLFSVDVSSDLLGDRCLSFQSQLDAVFRETGATELAVEDYFFSSKTCTGANVNAAYRTAAYMWACERKIPYSVLGISAWKTFVAGRSTPTAEQKKRFGSSAKKMMIVEALLKRHGIAVPSHSTSGKTGKQIKFKFDTSDAIGQAMYAAFMLYQTHTFISQVAVEERYEIPALELVPSKPKKSKLSESKSKPSESKSKPSESKSKPSKPSKPLDSKKRTKPSESKPSESKPSESKPSESKPLESKPSESKPSE